MDPISPLKFQEVVIRMSAVLSHNPRSGSSQIFTNRTLNLDRIRYIGFDMDYTLAAYRRGGIEDLAHRAAVRKLLDKGYPPTLGGRLPDASFAMRGLMVDKMRGNIVKMDRHGYVGRAFHGVKALSREQRKSEYRSQRLGREHERFVPIDTFFSLPELRLFAELVDSFSKGPNENGNERELFERLWNDVREAVDLSHQDDSIKGEVTRNPATYIEYDPDLPRTLHKLRSWGKKLFLLTNSDFQYTQRVLSFLLEGKDSQYPSWQRYFDYIIVSARKPSFFSETSPFTVLDEVGRPGTERVDRVTPGRLYSAGDQNRLQSSLDCQADEVLYVGDHIFADIVRSKRSSGWRTALIAPELEHDLQVREEIRVAMDEVSFLYEARSRLTEELSVFRHWQRVFAREDAVEQMLQSGVADAPDLIDGIRAYLQEKNARLKKQVGETHATLLDRRGEVDRMFNPYWGSAFFERYSASRFGAQIEEYACIYTSRVRNFLAVSPSAYFHAPFEGLAHWKTY